jgi:hypothetical protein
MDYLGLLVNQAAEELGPDATQADVQSAEDAFRRLAEEVAAELGEPEPAGAGIGGGGDSQQAAPRPIAVSGPQIEAVLGKLCPGFFPFC